MKQLSYQIEPSVLLDGVEVVLLETAREEWAQVKAKAADAINVAEGVPPGFGGGVAPAPYTLAEFEQVSDLYTPEELIEARQLLAEYGDQLTPDELLLARCEADRHPLYHGQCTWLVYLTGSS